MYECYEPGDLRILYAAFDVASYHLNVGSKDGARRNKLARACIKRFDGTADALRIAEDVVRKFRLTNGPN